MVRKKKQHEANAITTIDLGIRRHVSSLVEIREKRIENNISNETLKETEPKIDTNCKSGVQHEEIDDKAIPECKTTHIESSTSDNENPSTSNCTVTSKSNPMANNLSEQPNQSTLALLSYDYQSSSNSSDND